MKAIDYDERLRRARIFLDQARRVSLDGEGPSRGGRLNHKRSLLLNARRALGRLLAIHPPATATASQIKAARRLAQEIDDEPAPLLDEVRQAARLRK